ncbi:MAG: bifunctional adenosylcobinamide kinase/adenosylcobinamide-phosphate guanylyltransferase [Armatimonadetes bacterium CG_4_10_14_3_um_filter_66_18]|nr:bifunctional adenosylcobinamide kinase/adenosylcobinamide-phosphate guanylyltransferase [Armatimonadota bacterium]OIP10146.1 MAG: bifunctional adenosylcobinamide kinase/adenosylcobinamide-phosphate guanylyltransferase [Armatimonadetes bacterium CG2_30_66_41]PIU93169.1 MAG: bifunctional adenosylcobinamide kinase/adenosylcobinamide-phosphate guanylyltransferase [Armatimonadetes bacterium CG06_land_8_20_14_3_00_66_21]PIX49813.1 MAG: bifunctional adenosylcobinamide kinase/adenosylcobinamide-phosp
MQIGATHSGSTNATGSALPTVTLVLGGARSGKSRWALQHASHYERPVYLATAEPGDDEMRERIRHHQQERGSEWRTVEEPLEIDRVLTDGNLNAGVVLVDCLTLWLSNVVTQLGSDRYTERRDALLEALAKPAQPVVLVSNEVGMGIVPASELGREFRDLAGWLNQDMARVADKVVLVVAGLSLALKDSR